MGEGQGYSSVVEHVFSKFEALGSILSLKKEKWKAHEEVTEIQPCITSFMAKFSYYTYNYILYMHIYYLFMYRCLSNVWLPVEVRREHHSSWS